MNKLLKTIGWKDYRNRWDIDEILIDILILFVILIGVFTAMWYGK